MNIFESYFPALSDLQKQQLEALPDLYREWNERINVVSRKDMDEFNERHILHSLSLAAYTTFRDQSKILDLGTGGGLPGIPLAILFPQVQFHLVDSIGKKIKVVDEISQALDVKNVTTYHERAEKMKGNYDFVITRAVAPMNELVQWTRGKISSQQNNPLPNGILALKGGDLTEELKPFGKRIEVVPISNYFSEAFFQTKKIVFLPL